MNEVGPLGRLGHWAARRAKLVLIIWAVIVVGLGALAPRVEHALSGAGWEHSGSESVQARDLIQANFDGQASHGLMVAVSSTTATTSDETFKNVLAKVTTTLGEDPAVTSVVPPTPGMTISRDGHTAIVMAGAAANPTEMVRAADELKGPLRALGTSDVSVNLTGASGMWSDFNEANKTAMMKSEVLSWPVTLAILVFAFGALVAAGLPLMLTIVGLASSAGALWIVAQFVDVSIWAMNFALMFALALGIDYALFLLVRFRASLLGSHLTKEESVAVTMDTAGKAVLFSGLTVLISLSAVMLVPSPAFRSMALGIMIAVAFILVATLTLFPAVLGLLGDKVNRLSLPWVHHGEHRSPKFAAWGERLWKQPLRWGVPAVALLVLLAIPVFNLDTGMPSIKVVPEDDPSRAGYEQVQQAMGTGAPGMLHIVGPTALMADAATAAAADPGIAAALPAQPGAGGYSLVQAMPTVDPSDPALGETIDRIREAVPAGVLVGGAATENHDLEKALLDATPLAVAVVLALGFLLLLIALQAPVIAAIGVLTNLLATGAAFGVGKLIFQDGHLSGLLGFESQGFLDAWGPLFFFAMIFAISMDYTVFLLSSTKEHWDHSNDPREAMVGGLAHSGNVILAAAAVMVAVFLTFALSGPLPPKEMGIILGVAVLLDAFLVRLLLVPIALRLTGKWAWWQPRWLDRLLPDVKFGH